MIENERQYVISKAKIKEFALALAEIKSNELPKDLNEQLRYQAYIEQYNSQIEELSEDVKEYEQLKKGDIKTLKLDNLAQLAEALIKARIIRGLTQEQLAQRLGVKPQQVQRDEANKYASANLSKILKIQRALNLEVKEEIIFK